MATKNNNLAVALRQNNQRGQFKELLVGSGARILKANDEGLFMGGTSYISAPFKVSYAGVGSISTSWTVGITDLVRLNGSNGKLEFLRSGSSTVYASIATYNTSPYGLQLDAPTSSEVKITNNNETICAFNKSGANRRLELYNNKAIYATTDGTKLFTDAFWQAAGFYSSDGTEGKTDLTCDVRNAGDIGTTRLKFKDGLFIDAESI